jgi:AraC-like DNA-binding protein
MPSIPLPFVVSLLLAIIFVRMARERPENRLGNPLIAFVGFSAVRAAVVGLRWGYGFPLVNLAQPIMASALPSIAWVGFSGLQSSRNWTRGSAWLHALPVAAVAVLTLVWRFPIDIVLVALFVGYGGALLWLGRHGRGGLNAVRFGDEAAAHRALLIVGGMLIGSGLIDLVVAADFSFGLGAHAATIVAVGNVLSLAIIGYAAAVAEQARPSTDLSPEAPPDAPETGPSREVRPPETRESDAAILAAIDGLLNGRKLYRDSNLTLDRLARRAGIPARQISVAINRTHGRNVSQFVNAYRVAEAKRLLTDTDAPITEVMFEAGFQTKSNFNREFKRITGSAPSDYRRLMPDQP